ncbi:hypothetical protein [Permianibacter aggregans]|nr:hypothetical protein [Permianibacter aggregans]QGX39762.1 hypothetical protein E2H98_08875 [Permianibacter aggregans]
MKEVSDALIKTVENIPAPLYEIGSVAFAAGRRINTNSLEMSWYPNVHTRFHEISILIPKEKIVGCVGCWRFDVKPRIFVDHEWLESLYMREYSVFALVDVIGVRDALRENLLRKEKLIILRDGIDAIAYKYREISFISFADSLILKSNWSIGYFDKGVDCTYKPEIFLKIIEELKAVYRDVLGLGVYAVLTQGSNEYYDESLLHISPSKNHICLNSLGLPFAELLAIENAVKAAIKGGIHPPEEVYMDEQYYHSLRFRYDFEKNLKPSNEYKALMKAEAPHYFYSSLDVLLNNIESETENGSDSLFVNFMRDLLSLKKDWRNKLRRMLRLV